MTNLISALYHVTIQPPFFGQQHAGIFRQQNEVMSCAIWRQAMENQYAGLHSLAHQLQAIGKNRKYVKPRVKKLKMYVYGSDECRRATMLEF